MFACVCVMYSHIQIHDVMECAAGKGLGGRSASNSTLASQGRGSAFQREVQNKKLRSLELDGGGRQRFRITISSRVYPLG